MHLNFGGFIHLPMKMEPIQGSETSAIRTKTPGNYPKENILHIEHGESLKSRMIHLLSLWRGRSLYFSLWLYWQRITETCSGNQSAQGLADMTTSTLLHLDGDILHNSYTKHALHSLNLSYNFICISYCSVYFKPRILKLITLHLYISCVVDRAS